MRFIPKYDNFIKLLHKQEYKSNTLLENHHIVPKFEQNNGISTEIINDKNNIVRISLRHHTLAHYVRYKNFRKLGDKLAYLMRSGQDEKGARARAELIIKGNRAKGILFWSSDWQRLQGLKGGPKGGSTNTEKQFLARQAVGLAYGKKVGISNQSDSLQSFLKNSQMWQFNGGEVIVDVPPYESFEDVVRHINASAEALNVYRDKNNQIRTITNSTSFAKVRKRERNQMYGWSLVD